MGIFRYLKSKFKKEPKQEDTVSYNNEKSDLNNTYNEYYDIIRRYLPIIHLKDENLWRRRIWSDDMFININFDYIDHISIIHFDGETYDFPSLQINYDGSINFMYYSRFGSSLKFNTKDDFKKFLESGNAMAGYEIMLDFFKKHNIMTSNLMSELTLLVL